MGYLEKNIVQGYVNMQKKTGEKVEMVDIKHRMKLMNEGEWMKTNENEISRINEWKLYPNLRTDAQNWEDFLNI